MDPIQALSSPVIGLNLTGSGRKAVKPPSLTPMKVKKDPVSVRRRERAENLLNARLKELELELEQESISEWSDEEDPSSSKPAVDEANKENVIEEASAKAGPPSVVEPPQDAEEGGGAAGSEGPSGAGGGEKETQE
eukprot:scaffold1850_cov194-Pinguiococcus_pyrenoidosus.AAC.36